MMIVKTLLYTGIRVSELINNKLSDVDFHYCQIRINKDKGRKDRIVPFPQSFKEMLAMHADSMKKKQAVYLFESSWKKKVYRLGNTGNTKEFNQLFGGSRSCAKSVAAQTATFPVDLAQKAGCR
ncbi:tyrosine-type recombinase/integrase [Paenibacillus sp. BJ-4]|uniref:tyrosine-type recombinase/integrase n=1 Tax=Paenibacillus sp. BJ-4 TaxID=2878097 RepID=UPI0021F28B70|nr:tyrosine-type recombinase/integrase [Paenibacillus sp. BJ-4]